MMTTTPRPLPTLSLLLLLLFLPLRDAVPATVSITRMHRGDVFDVSDVKCSMETCVGTSSGTALQVDYGASAQEENVMFPVGGRGGKPASGMAAAGALPTNGGGCRCQCVQPLPVFRDDSQICVDDLQECSLASFVSGTTVQKIPYVFLPLQGQIVYPSAEIKISDTLSPICAISKAKYLTRSGWVNFKNQSDFEVPFQIHRENGRIMLLWLGDMQSRANIEGRLVLIEMICKETLPQDYDNSFHQAITPCISFRIAGTPNVKEVLFANDIRTSDNGATGSGLTVSELIAIAICSVLLGLMYVASILLYLHVRKGRSKGRSGDAEAFKNPLMSNGIADEGVVKNNPLLQHSYCNDNEAYESDQDRRFSVIPQSEAPMMNITGNGVNHHRNLTTAIVHPAAVQSYSGNGPCASHSMFYSESNSIEKHPEEDISIVETLDNKEERPDNIRSIVCANPRKKLYFNPDYFELELLMAPPPAALEFLEKIREVIHEAKRKITVKKFVPSLVVIPEDASEDGEEDATEKPSSCDKCKTQFKIKSATIQKWLMDVPPPAEPAGCVKNRTAPSVVDPADDRDAAAADSSDATEDDEDRDSADSVALMNIECDSLERSAAGCRAPHRSGYHTPSEYGYATRGRADDPSPVPCGSSALPMAEELTVNTAYAALPDNVLARCGGGGAAERGYSLVSEVYVNDCCDFDSGENSCKNITKRGPGRITIEVEDCPADRPAAEDSDGFEPDTLDRNSAKGCRRPPGPGSPEPGGAAATFGSLLEIYEAKSVMADAQKRRETAAANRRRPADARYLKPDPKHCRRQRCPSPQRQAAAKPPPKNARVRSASANAAAAPQVHGQRDRRRAVQRASDGRAATDGWPTADHLHNRYEDSGYLSTESNESFGCDGKPAAAAAAAAVTDPPEDTDEESGAESMDTDFKFFKTPAERNYCDW